MPKQNDILLVYGTVQIFPTVVLGGRSSAIAAQPSAPQSSLIFVGLFEPHSNPPLSLTLQRGTATFIRAHHRSATMLAASWTDDTESVRTYDSSMTAINPPLHHHLGVADRPQRPLVRYISDPHFSVPHPLTTADTNTLHQQRLAKSSPQHKPLQKQPSITVQHDRNSSSMTSISDAHLKVMFPLPSPRNPRNGGLHSFPKHLDSELDILDLSNGLKEDAMEAAWDDASCVDGASPRIEPADRMGGGKEDEFEVEALRRHVEQLQMALQLQSQQRELEMKLEQQQQQMLRRRPSQMQQARMNMGYSQDEWSAPPPTRQPPQRAPSQDPTSLRSARLLNPAHSATAASMLLHAPLPPTPLEAYHHSSEAGMGYYDHLHPTHHYPDIRRRQSILSQSQASSSPSLTASQTLYESASGREEEEKKIDDLNRKVDALQHMIQALTTHNPAPIAAEPRSWEGSDQGSAFRYNPTSVPQGRPRLVSSASIRANSSVTSSAPSTTAPTAAEGGGAGGKKGGKLASVFNLGFSKGSSSADVTTAALVEDVGRVSWSRKRTEKVSVPKAKVRQGPGRGRMVIKDTK